MKRTILPLPEHFVIHATALIHAIHQEHACARRTQMFSTEVQNRKALIVQPRQDGPAKTVDQLLVDV